MIFIRPWFLLLIVVPFLLWFFKKGLAPDNRLGQFVDKRLLPFVTVRFAAQKQRETAKLLGVFWIALVVAGSGPSFRHIEAPAMVSAPGTVIVMDLSPAMSKQNLTQAKLKLYDLLNDLKGHQVGLVLYDQKGYVASPLTQDIGIIRKMVPALAPDALPLQGNQPEQGFLKAEELFKNAGAGAGQIIFITAGGFDEKPLVELSKRLPYQTAILGIGNINAGTPIPLPEGGFLKNQDGSVAVAKLNADELGKVGMFVPATVDTTDVWKIVSQARGKAEAKTAADNSAIVWQDLGPLILLCVAPFFVFLFRRGVLFLLVICFSFSAEAGFLWRPDQEMYREQKAGVTAYRLENYEQAKDIFTKGITADAAYNEGNALAHLNDIPGAIKAYKKALGLNPIHEEAKFNKEYLEKQMPPSDQNQENQNQENQQNQSSESEQNQQDQAKENQSDPETDSQDKQEGEGQQKESGASAEQSESAEESDEKKGQNSEQMNEGQGQENSQESQNETKALPDAEKSQAQGQDQQPIPQFDQESQQLFNRVQHDPSRLLRYRLYQQSQRGEEE